MPRVLALGMHNNATSLLDTSTGELMPWDKLATVIVRGEGGYLIGTNLYRYVGALNQIFHGFPGWRMQIRAKQRTLIRDNRRSTIGSFLAVQFGFVPDSRNGSKGKGQKARIFHCVDLEDICGFRATSIEDALKYGMSILDLCEERGVKFTAARGGLAGRLLKASPHWEIQRRAAPQFINTMARTNLPGNFYGLGAKTTKVYKRAIYVDQTSAHHTVVKDTPMPHPDFMRARGFHRALERKDVRVWLRNPADVPGIGLLACIVSVNDIPDARKHLFPPFMHKSGRRLVYLYTNELEYFDGIHGTIEYVAAAWTSTRTDDALTEYASFAIRAREQGPGRKPLLLAAYGALALRTDRPSTTYYDRSRSGVVAALPGAGTVVEVTRVRKPNQPQPTIVNVLARGMIEAETRRRSLMLARDMDAMGIPVLSVYVDGLILDTERLPLLPPGWEVESALTNLRFRNPTSWTADEMSKLPGVPKAGRDREADVWGRMTQAAHGRAVGLVRSGQSSWRKGQKESITVARAINAARLREQREEATEKKRQASKIESLSGG